ncbi:MAG: 3-oxoacyl-[acyl-carrier-protein] reductase [Planctomycetota bacterium]
MSAADYVEEGVKSLVEELKGAGTEAIYTLADVSKFDQCQAIVDSTIRKFGRIDILVNNAGITRDNLIMRMKEEEWQQVLDVNLKGAFNCTKAAARPMLKQRGGRIINIASIIGLIGNAGQANYSASKAGVIALAKSTAKEFASRGITANAVAPGYIDTAMTKVLDEETRNRMLSLVPLARMGTSADVANAVLFLASDLAAYITGEVIRVDGGLVM